MQKKKNMKIIKRYLYSKNLLLVDEIRVFFLLLMVFVSEFNVIRVFSYNSSYF